MSAPTTPVELIDTARRLRDQARRLRDSAQYADSGQARALDLDSARNCDLKAEQMEKEAAQLSAALQ